jgi:hypothetical protein
MENLPTSREALIERFSKQSPSILPQNEISIYKGPVISNESIVKYSVKIRQAFPTLAPEFYDILLNMAKEEGFTDERFRDAVHMVIKTCVYPTPTIAQFISWDKRIKVFNYEEILKKWDEGTSRETYKPIKFSDREKVVWVDVDDIKKYNIKSE